MVEFAIAGAAFMVLSVGTAEVAYLLYAQSSLDNGARLLARQLQTNLAPKDGTGLQLISICPFVASFLDCSRIRVSVTPVADYRTDAGLDNWIANGRADPAAVPASNPGGSASLMLLRATYLSPSVVSRFIGASAAMPDGSAVYPVVSSVAYRNEF